MATGTSGTYSPSQSLERRHQQQKRTDFQEVDWARSDGRNFHQCRPASNFLRFGPRESKKAMLYSDVGRLNCHVTYTTFSTPIRGQGFENKEYSSMLHKALEGAIMLETFPKTTVDIFALVLESGGGSCFGKNMVIDPTSEEEACQDGSLMITYMPSRNEVTQFTLTGEWPTARINEAMELCLDACSKLADILRSCLKDNASELTA
ncbi:hypothetical protein KFK09_025529 [Dendrobium nobile]|uniref:Uncharacterized protein n=1 Tax=Dendrobium nobile TaxID=94219 RepID=A0A8T3AGM7_DENNO|nr:hypothetical protein KFK09_025529 [Dendrobium nobile]